MVDYYALLNLSPSASEDELKKALHREMRQWTNRTNAPQIERRQEAERRVKLLEQAEATLLDGPKRAQYDRELGSGAPASAAEQIDLAGVADLVEEARRLLNSDRVADALFVARKAVDANSQNPEAWALLGAAFSSFGEPEKAIGAYKRAIDLRPNAAGYHFDLGSIFESLEQWGEALRCYERAYKIDAAVLMYRAAYGVVLVKMGQPSEGIAILEQCVSQEPENPAYQWFLAIAFRESAYLGWTRVEDGQTVGLLEGPGYFATSIDHVVLAQEALTKALSLKFDDSALTQELTQLKEDVDSNTKRTFMGNWFVGGIVGAIGALMGAQGWFLLASAALYIAVSFVPLYVINNQLAKGNTFDEFGWISRTFHKGDGNLVMMGIGFLLMIFAVPVFAVYNLYRYHGDAIRRFLTSSQNKDRMSAMMAKLQGVAKQTAGAASGALSNLSSRDKGADDSTPLADPAAASSTPEPNQSNPTSTPTPTPTPTPTASDAKRAASPVGPAADKPPSPIPPAGDLRSAMDALKSRVPAELKDVALREGKRHIRTFIISKLVMLGVVGVIAVAGVVLVIRQFSSQPPSTDADRATAPSPSPSVTKVNPPTNPANDTASLLLAKLSAAEQCFERGDLACATAAADEALRLDPRNVSASGMKRRIALQSKEQARVRAEADARAAAEARALAAAPALAPAPAPAPAQAPVPAQTQPQGQVPTLPPQAIPIAPSSTSPIPNGGMAQDRRTGCRVSKPSLAANEAVAWSGQCLGGLANGPGVAQWTADGKSTLTYEGSFRSGMLQGRGLMTAAGGDRYEGDYRDGKREGRGAYIAATGERYDGEFKDNRRDGRGVVTRADGTRVEGVFKEGKLIAEGTPPIPKTQTDSRSADAERQRLVLENERLRAQVQRSQQLPMAAPMPTAPVATAPPQPVAAQRTVTDLCSGRNLISEQLCRGRTCLKPEHASDPICVGYKEAQERQRTQQ